MRSTGKLFSVIKKYKWLLLSFGIVVAICVVLLLVGNDHIPSWVNWKDKEISFDSAEDEGYSGVEISLRNKKLRVLNKNGEITFTSEKGFKVQDVFATDIDRDGDKEMIALLWKRGKYGKHRPFWVKSDEKSYSQHIFLYDLNPDGSVAHKWGASEIGVDALNMKVMEKNASILLIEDKDKKCTLWTWEGWGLKNIENEVSVAAFGDNLIHEPIYEHARNVEDGSFDFLYEPFIKEIQDADIAALNAETVLVDNESMVGGYPSFGSPLEVGEAIKKAGFDVASCANNHVLDRGLTGIDITTSFYKDNEITCVGIQSSDDADYRPYEIISKNGIRIALFSYTYGTNAGDISKDHPNVVHYLPKYIEASEQDSSNNKLSDDADKLVEDLKSAREEVDFVIVFAHWGEEYNKEITKEQEWYTKLFAMGGSDVILGSHPHVVQETKMVERPDGGDMLVYYSLGNFRAVQGQSEDTKKGAEAYFTIGYSFDGVEILNYETKEIDAYWK